MYGTNSKGDTGMEYTDEYLIDLIKGFLTQRRESDVWDVKLEWQETTDDLLKDVVCFVNTTHNRDCFLIYGVNDDLQVCGMSKKRVKQNNLLDALSNLKFAGGIVPSVEIKTISMCSDIIPNTMVDIDVLVIYNTDKTPVYLESSNGNMLRGCIYSRVGDKNTPNKGNSSCEQIEKLWRKRFGLLKPPLEFIIESFNNKEDWKECEEGWYYIYKPEYKLHLYDRDDFEELTIRPDPDEFYAYALYNERMYFMMLEYIANNTKLASQLMVILDSGRLMVPVPDWYYTTIPGEYDIHLMYVYYIQGSNVYKTMDFFYHQDNSDENWAFHRFTDVVLIFESEKEFELFNVYIENHYGDNKLKKLISNCTDYNYISVGDEYKKKVYMERLRTGVVLKKLLDEYREKCYLNNM